MYKKIMGIAVFVLAACTGAFAQGKPIWAAEVEHSGEDTGTVCLVTDADGAIYLNADCKWMFVTKLNNDGTPKFARYHDHAQLPEGAALPDRKMEFVTTGASGFFFGAPFVQREIINPSGEYSSSYIEKPE